MKFNFFFNSIVAVFLLLSVIFPAYAQGPTTPVQQCVLSRDSSINIRVTGVTTDDIATIKKDAVISSILAQTTGQVITESGTTQTMTSAQRTEITERWGIICVINTINVVIDWIFYALIAVVLLLVALAAFFWTISSGDSGRQKKAKDMIIAALIGLTIALLSRMVPNIITGILA